MGGLGLAFLTSIVHQLTANDPTWGIRFQQAAEKQPFLDEMTILAGGASLNATEEEISDLVAGIVS